MERYRRCRLMSADFFCEFRAVAALPAGRRAVGARRTRRHDRPAKVPPVRHHPRERRPRLRLLIGQFNAEPVFCPSTTLQPNPAQRNLT